MPKVALPQQIGHYRILKQLGEGGMGRVYLGEDPNLQRKVAIKVMLDQFSEHPDARKRFVREVRSMASVKSNHIVVIYEIDEGNGCPFFSRAFPR